MPPCFIVVCNNTSASKLVYDFISGFDRTAEDGSSMYIPGRFELFRNADENGNAFARPRTLLIDSSQLESGEALDDNFRAIAGPEIERFRREVMERTGDKQKADNFSDQDLLREVMNTVGKPDRLGESIRCVVSVSMLTEGWDANTVTHVLGVRAFGTQLLCEQVIGRALRRQSYDLNHEGLFNVEYADVLGIPFDFNAKPVVAPPQPPRETILVRAVRPERDHLEIRFPRVSGYRVELPEEKLTAEFNNDSILILDPRLVGPSITRVSGIIGEAVDLNLEHLEDTRMSTVLFCLAKRLVYTKWRDPGEEPRVHLFGQLKRITKQWLDGYLRCEGGTFPAQLLYQDLADLACDRITAAITRSLIGERPVKAMLDPYNPEGSTNHVRFTTSKPDRWETSSDRCHINWAMLDSDWEGELCRVVESHPRVRAYVKNHNLGLEVPYRWLSETRRYLPDFILRVEDGHGEDDLLNLVVEIKGYRGEDAKQKKDAMDTYWIPGVNNLGTYGRWAFAEFTKVYAMEPELNAKLESEIERVIAILPGPNKSEIPGGNNPYNQPQNNPDVRLRYKPELPLRSKPDVPVTNSEVGQAILPARRLSAGGRAHTTQDPPMAEKPKQRKTVETLTHEEASRRNIPTAEYQSLIQKEYQDPLRVAYERRNRDLDPQLIWRGKDQQDWSDLVVNAPPIYIQEKVHPKVLIDDLTRRTRAAREEDQFDLFADFNGLPTTEAKTEFYQHDANWTNRMILGDSLQVMASLAEREGLRGQVQCIYFDPPYGIKFNSNFQWSTTSRDVKDGDKSHITREPEQVKAFRDTWRDGIHSYLTYLRDRLTAARDLMRETGCIFVQIGDENVHRLRALLDEAFGDDNYICTLSTQKTGSVSGDFIQSNTDMVLWYAKNKEHAKSKHRTLFLARDGQPSLKELSLSSIERSDFSAYPLTSDGYRQTTTVTFAFEGGVFHPGPNRHWGVRIEELMRAAKANRILRQERQVRFRFLWDDYPVIALGSYWADVGGATAKTYVVQTSPKVLQRLILSCTDPGDLVLDPTCGSGTTAYVAEQWGRRWITIDTSRVALALARARIMGTRHPYYLLADSPAGQTKEAEVTRTVPSSQQTRGDIRQGFVYERVPHITLKSIANNTEIDVIWEKFQRILEPLRESLNQALSQKWEEWQIPRTAEETWPQPAKDAHAKWWQQRIARQKEIDASIAAKAEYEYLYDKPYEDKSKVRVAGPFTVEGLSPHRVLGVDENDELIDPQAKHETRDFAQIILENLRTAGVQQAHKEDKIVFSGLTPWPGDLVCAEGRYTEGTNANKRAAIFIGPEFGTVSRPDLVQAAREAADAEFDVLIACAFNFDAHSSEFRKLGSLPVLKARMNADLHMAEDLKNTGKGNLFVIFGEPDIDLLPAPNGQWQVKINGVDVFHPATGEVRSDGPEGIACWFLDTDYNEESFFVRHAYFLGANDPYKSLKTTLKAEIDEDAWATLHSDTSRPFDKPDSGRIAVKVINHLGDEVMKVFRVQ